MCINIGYSLEDDRKDYREVKWQRLKYSCYVVFLVCAVILSPIISTQNASAFNLGSASTATISSLTGYSTSAGTVAGSCGYYQGSYCQIDVAKGGVYQTQITTNSTISGQKVLFSINYQVQFAGTSTTSYKGVGCQDSTCIQLASNESIDDDIVSGWILLYYPSFSGKNINLNTVYTGPDSVLFRFLSPISYAYITDEGSSGSSVDLTIIQNYLKSIDANQLISAQRLQSILEAINRLGDNATSSDIQGVVDAQNKTNDLLEQQQQQEQKDREDLQQGIDDSKTETDAAQEDVTAGTASLLSTITSFLGIIKDTPATNCRVNANLGNLDLGQMDYCTGKPSEFNNLFTIVAALVLAPVGYIWAKHIISDMLSLLESFTGYPMGDFD